MPDNAVKNFNISNADLITICNSIHGFMVRDATEFITYGILALETSAFKTKIDEFEDLPTDTELEADLVIATSTKNGIAENLRIMLRPFETRAKLAFKTDSGEYKKFHSKDLSRLNDNDLLVFGRMVKRAADEYLTQLTPYGLTQIMIDSLEQQTDDFEDTIESQLEAIANRDVATNNRVKKANALYELLVKYCDIGKAIWYEVNEAKYNDYVLYSGGASGKPGKIQNLIFTASNSRLSWTPEQIEVDLYQLEYSTDGENFSLIYEDVDTSYGFGQAPGTYYARCRGVNKKGNGAWSDVLQFEKTLSTPVIFDYTYSPGTHELLLQWHPVIYSQSYDLYRSAVALGEPAGEFTFYQNLINPMLQQELIVFNQTLYFYCIAKLGSQVSDASNTVSVNVPA